VITVCFNSAETVRDAIESVLSQDYPDIEYIIVDGGSTDDTMAIASGYSSRIHRIISGPDDGLWDAMNKGIEIATGEYIGFLNSDDLFSSASTVSNLVCALKRDRCDAIFGFVDIVDRRNLNRVIRRYRVRSCSKLTLRLGIMPAHPGFLCHRSFFERYGAFVVDTVVAPDFELMVRFVVKGGMRAILLPKVIVRMRYEGVSNRGIMSRVLRYRSLVRACRMNGLWTSSLLINLKWPYRFLEYLRRA
jgi:glycosyltransferase involved in cell wall biosynthesis